jgi:hypothetical protein
MKPGSQAEADYGHSKPPKILHVRPTTIKSKDVTMKISMKKVTLEFTPEELGVLTTMASDQLFRKQFIDPKMPGFVQNHDELDLCKSVVGRLRTAVEDGRGKPEPAAPPVKRKSVGR